MFCLLVSLQAELIESRKATPNVVMLFVDDLGYPQIGERVGMSLEAVRKSLFRVKKQVRACVESGMRGAE